MTRPDRSAPQLVLIHGGACRLKSCGRFAARLLEVLRRVELDNGCPNNASQGGTECI